MTAVEHPTEEQIDRLRENGWTMSGLKASRPDAGVVGWREALALDAGKQENR